MTRQNLLVNAANLLLIGLLLGNAACEEDGGSDNSGHDFGVNNPDLVVALGDSITHGYGLAGSESYPAQLGAQTGRPVINSGADGERSSGGLGRVNSVLNQHKPGFLLILYGSNDLIFGADLNGIVGNLRGIIQAAKANQTIPIIATVPPAFPYHDFIAQGVVDLNPLIQAMAAEEGVAVANVFNALNNPALFQSDGLHPTAEGAGKIASAFAGKL